MQQAKVNVKDDPKYKEANQILELVKDNQERKPRSPKEWNKRQYGGKGITIFATTLLASVSLTQAILSFDYITMLTYLFTIIMGLIFGVIQMKNAEVYWTTEFYEYALRVRDQEQKEEEECSKSET